MQIIKIFCLNFVFIYILFAVQCYSQEYISTKDTVALLGKLSIRYFKDINGQSEKVFLLTLIKSINVDADEYGDKVENIRTIQVVFSDNVLYPGAFGEKIKISDKYLKKRVIVTGLLFHQLTAHHYKKIIMRSHGISLEKDFNKHLK
jgi:wyosine [tRNA(Phe)-imidazoG37] synthetase (radical SAM superfamily)